MLTGLVKENEHLAKYEEYRGRKMDPRQEDLLTFEYDGSKYFIHLSYLVKEQENVTDLYGSYKDDQSYSRVEKDRSRSDLCLAA